MNKHAKKLHLKRINEARRALCCNGAAEMENLTPLEMDEPLIDLLTNLMHYCSTEDSKTSGLNFLMCLFTAYQNFTEEQKDLK